MIIPSNLISIKYTIGGEFIDSSTYQNYQGYYYELNSKFFAGKKFNPNAKEIIKKDSNSINPLLVKANTFTYGNLSRTSINTKKPKPFLFNPDDTKLPTIRYFLSQINVKPIKIQEVDELTFGEYQNNAIYNKTSINYPYTEQDINRAEKELPGVKSFIESVYSPGVTD